MFLFYFTLQILLFKLNQADGKRFVNIIFFAIGIFFYKQRSCTEKNSGIRDEIPVTSRLYELLTRNIGFSKLSNKPH